MPDEIILIRGDTADIAISGLLDDQGNPTVFGGGDVLTWTAKERLDAYDTLLVKTSPAGITIQVGTDQATVNIVPADWTNIHLPADLTFVWDIQITVGGDPTKISTLDSGTGTIRADVDQTFTAPTKVGGTTCTPWATGADVLPSCIGGVLDPTDLAIALQIASDVLYELCPRKYRGTCTDEVRPLAKWRPQRPAGWWSASLMGNTYRYGWCSCNRAPDYGCASIPQIILPGFPVDPASIEVTIDGDPFTDFELLDRRRLVRTDGSGWPCCQDLLLPLTEVGTFGVRYAYGVDPPVGGKRAAAILGCELYKSWHPESGTCNLPERVTNIVRQGVSMAILDPLTLFSDGRVGIPYVDLWLSSQRLGERQRASLIVPGQGRKVTRTR